MLSCAKQQFRPLFFVWRPNMLSPTHFYEWWTRIIWDKLHEHYRWFLYTLSSYHIPALLRWICVTRVKNSSLILWWILLTLWIFESIRRRFVSVLHLWFFTCDMVDAWSCNSHNFWRRPRVCFCDVCVLLRHQCKCLLTIFESSSHSCISVVASGSWFCLCWKQIYWNDEEY